MIRDCIGVGVGSLSCLRVPHAIAIYAIWLALAAFTDGLLAVCKFVECIFGETSMGLGKRRLIRLMLHDPQPVVVGDVNQVACVIRESGSDSGETLNGSRICRITQVEDS